MQLWFVDHFMVLEVVNIVTFLILTIILYRRVKKVSQIIANSWDTKDMKKVVVPNYKYINFLIRFLAFLIMLYILPLTHYLIIFLQLFPFSSIDSLAFSILYLIYTIILVLIHENRFKSIIDWIMEKIKIIPWIREKISTEAITTESLYLSFYTISITINLFIFLPAAYVLTWFGISWIYTSLSVIILIESSVIVIMFGVIFKKILPKLRESRFRDSFLRKNKSSLEQKIIELFDSEGFWQFMILIVSVITLLALVVTIIYCIGFAYQSTYLHLQLIELAAFSGIIFVTSELLWSYLFENVFDKNLQKIDVSKVKFLEDYTNEIVETLNENPELGMLQIAREKGLSKRQIIKILKYYPNYKRLLGTKGAILLWKHACVYSLLKKIPPDYRSDERWLLALIMINNDTVIDVFYNKTKLSKVLVKKIVSLAYKNHKEAAKYALIGNYQIKTRDIKRAVKKDSKLAIEISFADRLLFLLLYIEGFITKELTCTINTYDRYDEKICFTRNIILDAISIFNSYLIKKLIVKIPDVIHIIPDELITEKVIQKDIIEDVVFLTLIPESVINKIITYVPANTLELATLEKKSLIKFRAISKKLANSNKNFWDAYINNITINDLSNYIDCFPLFVHDIIYKRLVKEFGIDKWFDFLINKNLRERAPDLALLISLYQRKNEDKTKIYISGLMEILKHEDTRKIANAIVYDRKLPKEELLRLVKDYPQLTLWFPDDLADYIIDNFENLTNQFFFFVEFYIKLGGILSKKSLILIYEKVKNGELRLKTALKLIPYEAKIFDTKPFKKVKTLDDFEKALKEIGIL